MDQAEASGKTVDDALNRALNMIGASRADLDAERVEMQVLDEGRKGGLFGRGARDAVVRVVRVAATPATSGGGERSSRGGRGRGGSGSGSGQQPQQAQRGEGGQRSSEGSQRGSDGGQRRGRRSGGASSGSGGGGSRGGRTATRYEQVPPKLTEADFVRPRYDEETAAGPEAAGEPAPASSGRGRRSRGGGGNGEPREQREQRAQANGRGDRDRGRRREREEEPEVEPDINAEEVDFAARTVDDILRLLDINAELTIREPLTAGDGRGTVRAVIDIAGDDLGLLIGRRGETLLSLQYLVNLIVTRQYPGRAGVSIDVEHYRHRREGQVVALAQRMADRVRQTGSPITLEPMSAAERRLVHIALADDPELVTNSVGEGENRKVVISTRR